MRKNIICPSIRAVMVFFGLGILGSLLPLSVAFAQHAGYHPVADFPAFKKKFAIESSTIQTITSNFTQEKTLEALTEKIVSTGKFWYKRSNQVRIEYMKPYFYLMILKDGKMLVRDDQKENKVNVRSVNLFRQVNRLLIDCVQGTIFESKDFSLATFENEQTFLIEMKPVSKGLLQFFQVILLTVEKRDYSLMSIEMDEPSGDKTIISFRDKKLNESVSDALFTF